MAHIRRHWQAGAAITVIIGAIAGSVTRTDPTELDAGFYSVSTIVAGSIASALILFTGLTRPGPMARAGTLLGAVWSVGFLAVENLMAVNWSAAIPDGQTGLVLPMGAIIVALVTSAGGACGAALDAWSRRGGRARIAARGVACVVGLVMIGGGTLAEARVVLDRRDARHAAYARVDACVERHRDLAGADAPGPLEYYIGADYPDRSVRRACLEDGAIGPGGMLVDVFADA